MIGKKYFKSLFKTKWIVVVVLVSGFVLWKFVFATGGEDEVTIQVEKGRVTEDLILLGSVQADEHAQLKFLASGELVWVGVSEGDSVKKGQVLARLDQSNLNALYKIALADFQLAEATLDRVYDQIKGHDDSESFALRETRVTAESARNKAYQSLVVAQKNLAAANLKAPFDGIVTKITYPYGNVATTPAEGQMEIVNPETLYFRVSADQSEIDSIYIGQKVEVVLDSYGDTLLKGEVEYIGITPRLGELGTVYDVVVGFVDEIGFGIMVGMTGDAKFIIDEKEDAYFVQPRFVKEDEKGRYINLGRKNNKVYVKVGIEGEDRIEIMGDVKQGDVVYY